MGRFVNSLTLVALFLITGCATSQMPEYISRADHPYERQIYANFDKVVGVVTYVLKQKGWKISTEALPSIYERDERYDNNGYRNLLIMTTARGHEHLNVFIHGLNNTCDVEIRYESKTTMVKQFSSIRNDKLVNGILEAVEQEINR